LVLAPLCFARYYERRLKSTTQAYIYIIVMHRPFPIEEQAATRKLVIIAARGS
jgi:hypothetical protein